jgi:hypothetical protein
MPDIPVELAYRGYLLQVQDEDNPDAYRNVSLTCEVDKSQSTSIEKAALGCERVHFDFEEDKKSYGASKWVVSETGETLTSCLEDRNIEYLWDLVPAGWDDRDADLVSYQKRQYVVEVSNKTLPMTMPAIHDGEKPVGYQLVDTRNAGFDDYFYDDADPCIKYQKSHEVRVYERPDGSTYTYISNDPGEPIQIGNMCETLVTWGSVSTRKFESYGQTSGPCGTSTRGGTVGSNDSPWSITSANHCTWSGANGTKSIVRDDGQIMAASETKYCETSPNAYPHVTGYHQYRPLSYYNWSYPAFSEAVKISCRNNWGWY